MSDQHVTTLGAPISYEEYEVMQQTFLNTKMWLTMVPHTMPPEKFLAVATRLIEEGFRLRDAVQKGLNAANARRTKIPVGGYRTPDKKKLPTALSMFSQADIQAALEVIRSSK